MLLEAPHRFWGKDIGESSVVGWEVEVFMSIGSIVAFAFPVTRPRIFGRRVGFRVFGGYVF